MRFELMLDKVRREELRARIRMEMLEGARPGMAHTRINNGPIANR